jgi:superfamily II DNA or RNA helicase
MRILRDCQNDAVTAIYGEWAKVSSTMIVAATGTGKTVIMAKVVKDHEGKSILFLAHRNELLLQAQEKIGAELGYLPAIEKAELGVDPYDLWQDGLVLVASVQTLRNDKRLKKFERRPFDFILIDECHHAVAASYRKIIDYFLALNPQCKILGVTATPRRTDDVAMGTIFASCAYQMSISDAIGLGWLVPVRQELITIENVDFSGVRITRNEFGEADFNLADLQAVMSEEEPLHAMAVPLLDKARGRPAVVFTAGVPHAHGLAAVLNREKPGCAAAVDGETDPDKRNQIVRDFHEGRIQFLCNFGIFTEGFDCPPASVVGMGRPTKSVLLKTQMLGRVLRPLDGVVDGYADAHDRKMAILTSNKDHALCLDFVGTSRHKLVTAMDVLGGNYDLSVLERARQNVDQLSDAVDRPAIDVGDQLQKASSEMILEEEQKRRRKIRPRVTYTSEEIDPFGRGSVPHVDGTVERTRGGSTDKQIAFLVNLGVSRQTAAGYTKRQAGAVIDKLTAERCTIKQQKTLLKFGENPSVSFERASQIIGEIEANGWRRR